LNRLAGKRAIVIGAGSVGPGWGNGKATAVLMAREGARVLAVDRNPEAAAETVALIIAEGGSAGVFAGDMTSPEAAEAAVGRALALWDGIDILHFNIGTSHQGGILDGTAESWRTTFAVNLDAAVHATRAVLPTMLRGDGGSLTYISSIAAIRSGPYAYPSYEASKAALGRFARSVAVEYAARGIRANVILPGLMDTPHVVAHVAPNSHPEELAARRAAIPPMKRQGSPWDVAEAAVFLSSDAAGYITGQSLAVDGGLSCVYTSG
jgi:NAD(P)-dependent dehydrogenase (short-subunit alcohol dehydrogenase family)